MTPKETVAEIASIIGMLIKAGLSNQQNWPALSNHPGKIDEIAISGNPTLNIAMKDIAYRDIYLSLDTGKAFHVKMLDGALIQMCYRFVDGAIQSHRLCMFPAPDLEAFDSEPEIYERDEIYADIVARNLVHFPIRFDFDNNPDIHVDIKHPKSHLTLGQYPNCRIPLTAPLSPARFITFILRNFYHVVYHESDLKMINCKFSFADTISSNERTITHIIG